MSDASAAVSVADVEAEKLRTWCADAGVENSSDLAFYFTSFDEALEQAGRVVAAAWLDARSDTNRGLSALVRNLFKAETVPQGRPTPSVAPSKVPLVLKPAQSLRPSKAVSRLSVEKPTASGFVHQILAVILAFTPVSQGRSAEMKANFTRLAESVCERTEAATIQKALSTCWELKNAISKAGLSSPDPHFLATFIRTHASPKRAFQGLCWTVRNLKTGWDLQLVVRPKRAQGARYGMGAAQAAPLEPGMVVHLVGLLEHMQAHHHWPILFSAFCMIFGVVRFAHIQRSYLLGFTGAYVLFWCWKGKTGTREGFLWSIPHVAGSLDLMLVINNWLKKVRPLSGEGWLKWHYLAFDGDTKVPASMPQFLRVLKPLFQDVLDASQLTSYSFRRVLPTLAGVVNMPDLHKLALGQWLDKSQGVSNTPVRYDASKVRLGHQLRISAYAYLAQLTEVTWEAIPRQHAELAWQYCMQEADSLIAEDPRTVWVSKQNPPGMPVMKSLQPSLVLAIRNLGLKKLKRQQALPVSLAPAVGPDPSKAAAEHGTTSTKQESPQPASRKRAAPASAPAQVKKVPKPHPWRQPKPVVLKEAASSSSRPDPAPQRPPEPALPPRRSSVETKDEAADDHSFNAAARWATPGHSGNPEPPTLLLRGTDGTGNLWLGGLPKNAEWLRQHGVSLVLSAMGKVASESGGVSRAHFYQHAVPVSHHGQQRDHAWREAKGLAMPTLRAGESVYVHCLAGVHRAPVLAALLLAWVTRRAFNDCYRQVEQLRAVDPEGVKARQGGAAIFAWAASRAADDMPQRFPRGPFTFICSRKRGSLWHICKDDAPWCQWRQATSTFKGEVYHSESVEEALGYGRSICRMCKGVLPATLQLRAGN